MSGRYLNNKVSIFKLIPEIVKLFENFPSEVSITTKTVESMARWASMTMQIYGSKAAIKTNG